MGVSNLVDYKGTLINFYGIFSSELDSEIFKNIGGFTTEQLGYTAGIVTGDSSLTTNLKAKLTDDVRKFYS
jgi:hypothetical protein